MKDVIRVQSHWEKKKRKKTGQSSTKSQRSLTDRQLEGTKRINKWRKQQPRRYYSIESGKGLWKSYSTKALQRRKPEPR